MSPLDEKFIKIVSLFHNYLEMAYLNDSNPEMR